MRKYVVLSTIVLTLIPASANAQLDAELDKPYEFQVVLQIAKHRLLTDVFKKQVQRELEDGLQAAFGSMAKVQLVTTHPQLREIQAKGLKALDTWKARSTRKTHFILVSYKNGRYHLKARQHDGLTGQPSSVVRTASTPDRPFVARLATLLIDRDFGMVGTFQTGVDPSKEFVMQLKGAKLTKELQRWVPKGAIFGVVHL